MIGNPKWFKRRKYLGWGFMPETWQGWVYITMLIAFIMIIPNISLIPENLKTPLIFIIGLIFSFDTLDIMIHLNKDERETYHEAVAERNALWSMIAILAIGAAYQTAVSLNTGFQKIDPFIIAALFAGMLAKTISNWYLRDK